MAVATVNISFQTDLLRKIDAEAKRESRSRSELLREAARIYVERQRRWEAVFDLGDATTRKRGLTESDVSEEIANSRRDRNRRG